MKKEQFCCTNWYLIASTAKVTQDLINEYVEPEWDESLYNVIMMQADWYDPAKSTEDICADIATILENTLDEKNNFYLKYAN
jgi:hypothetical protein